MNNCGDFGDGVGLELLQATQLLDLGLKNVEGCFMHLKFLLIRRILLGLHVRNARENRNTIGMAFEQLRYV